MLQRVEFGFILRLYVKLMCRVLAKENVVHMVKCSMLVLLLPS
jgi:hypothetical protein